MTVIKDYPLLRSFLLSFVITSCSSSEIGNSKDVNQETIYQDYKIEYTETEKDDMVVVWAQFRFAGDKGTTLVLNNPSKIEFDGTAIKVDSNDYSGAFYQLNLPAKNFFTRHHFEFINISNKKFYNDFSFDDFRLVIVPPTAATTQPLNLQFETKPLQGDDYIEVDAINTDSSFTIKHLASVSGNILTIPVNELQRQKGKELSLLASIYRKISLQQQTKEGGQIVTVHILKPVTVRLTDNTEYAAVH